MFFALVSSSDVSHSMLEIIQTYLILNYNSLHKYIRVTVATYHTIRSQNLIVKYEAYNADIFGIRPNAKSVITTVSSTNIASKTKAEIKSEYKEDGNIRYDKEY